MLRFSDPAGSVDGSRKRRRRSCLPLPMTASAPRLPFRGSIAQPARTPTDASPPPSRAADGRGRDGPSPLRARPAPAQIPACGSRDRNQARAPRGECSNWPRFLKPLYDPGRSDFPSPVLASVLHAISQGGPSPSARNCGAGAPFAPSRWSLHRPFATMQASRNPALCLVRTRLSWPPSAQSPFARSGCYPRRGGLKAAWRGVTPSSSLVRAHAPDHPPPRASARALRAGSLQVLASRCWAMALPDVISAILA